MTIVIPGWAIILGVLSLVDDAPPAAPPPAAPLEFWLLFWSTLIFGVLVGCLVDHFLQKRKP